MATANFILGEQSVPISYDAYGVCKIPTIFNRVSAAVEELKPVHSGLTGGSHGTDHGFEDYAADDGWIVRVVRPGALTSGWLEVRAGQ